MRTNICFAIPLAIGLVAHAAHAARLEHARVWSFAQGGGVANLVAYDAGRGRVYAGGGTTLHALDMATGVPLPVGPVTVSPANFLAITSVAAYGDLVAVSVIANPKTAPGKVLLYNAEGLALAAEIMVGAGPDMLTFTPDGTRILVANEGEPDDAYKIDPEGSVSVIDVATRTVQPARFTAFNGQKQQLIEDGVRIFGPNEPMVAQDLEPETIAARNDRAWATLQENNALALIALPPGAPPVVTAVVPLGFKDHGRDRNALDVSDTDGVAGNLQTHENLFGMYQPDGIAVGTIGGTTYLFTANEGDARDYDGFSEEARAGTLPLAPGLPTDLARLRVTTKLGNLAGVYTRLFAFGGRSFAVWDTGGHLIHDSGKNIEKRLPNRHPEFLLDSRSDDKGSEPEDVTLGTVGNRPYLFVGLERADGVMAVDVSVPSDPEIADFVDGGACPTPAATRPCHMPERLAFVPASSSPSGRALLLVTNELSATTAAYELWPGQ